jgi:hypothetical protein
VRLIACHVAGVLTGSMAMPYLLSWGLEIRNLVLAWVLGSVVFLALACAGSFILRRSIMAHPIRWAAAAPPVLALAIYISLRALSGFEPGEARIAMETSYVAGVCALFSSVFFLLWTYGGAPAPPGKCSAKS